MGDQIVPLEPKEWGDLAKRLLHEGLEPKDLFDFSKEDFIQKLGCTDEYAERLLRLIGRNASLVFELAEYKNIGIHIITRADKEYPARLKSILGNGCPPLFHYSGNLELLNKEYIGYVGSRTISDEDISFTRSTVQKTLDQGYGVVSGGAKGVDSIAAEEALLFGAPVIEYLSDSMTKKMRKGDTTRNIREGNLLLMSVVKPDSPFNVGIAMMRNRYIYAQSSGTIVIRSEFNKGGTWAGATENIKHNWCPLFCRSKNAYQGNRELIKMGAIPIDEAWDGSMDKQSASQQSTESTQLSIFDI